MFSKKRKQIDIYIVLWYYSLENIFEIWNVFTKIVIPILVIIYFTCSSLKLVVNHLHIWTRWLKVLTKYFHVLFWLSQKHLRNLRLIVRRNFPNRMNYFQYCRHCLLHIFYPSWKMNNDLHIWYFVNKKRRQDIQK